MKVALIQMSSNKDKDQNLSLSLDLLDQALKGKPELVIFPEYQMYSPDYADPKGLLEASESKEGNFVSTFAERARKAGVKILINMAESSFGSLKPFNTSVMIDDLGMVIGKYRKLHLFDAYSKLESSLYDYGRMPLNVLKTNKFTMGLQICYDLRFPEPARYLSLQGAQILSYQAGWYSGERKLDIWRNLLRTRAIENGTFVLGTAQCGKDFTGHSMVVSPYGDVLAEAENDNAVVEQDLDFKVLKKYAEDVPMLKQRRKDLYDVSGL